MALHKVIHWKYKGYQCKGINSDISVDHTETRVYYTPKGSGQQLVESPKVAINDVVKVNPIIVDLNQISPYRVNTQMLHILVKWL